MDVLRLEKFLNYAPFMEADSSVLLDRIIQKAQKYLPSHQIPFIHKAYAYAAEKHAGQLRLSGEPYIVHSLKATNFLMQIKPDVATIQTCLLHDVVEDCDVSIEAIEETFGPEVAVLCEGMVKVSKIKYTGEDRHLETIKKTFLAMANDLRVIFVKLADRIHNIQTLEYHPNIHKRENIARETMKIYVPIAKRLGLYQYQLYLENGSFKVLYPQEFDHIFSYLKKYFGTGEKYTEKGIRLLTNLLNKEGIRDFDVKGRIKSPYRIFEKMEYRYQSHEIANVMDLLAYRIITKTVADCYMVLGAVHKHYTPLIKKIKDYIAVPKFNGYQSIHTTVLGMFNFPAEIQIRTYEMDDVAELGVAAHFAYMENKSSVLVSQSQTEWIKRLHEIVSNYKTSDDKEGFTTALNIEVLDKRIFLYTPRGDVLELPTGSTVLDFAFAVHTDIGLRFKHAIVNGEIKPITFIPQTGDVIRIDTFKNRYSANKHWVDFLHTPGARASLLKFLKTQQKDDILKQVKIDFGAYLLGLHLPSLGSVEDSILKYFDEEELERRYMAIYDKKDTFSSLVKEVYPKQRKAHTQQQTKKPVHKQPVSTLLEVIVDGDPLLNYYFCPECKPQHGQKIIAKSGRDGLKIHTVECRSMKTVNFDKLLEAHRADSADTSFTEYQVSLEFTLASKYANIMNIIKVFSELNVPISEISLKNFHNGTSMITLDSMFSNPSKLVFLLNSLKKMDDSIHVVKKKIT